MKSSQRNIRIRKTSLREETDDLKNTTTAAECWAMMWQMSLDAWAFRGEPIAEPGLYRHSVRILRRKS